MEQIYNIPLNEFQTPIEKLHIEKSPQEVREQFFDFLNNVPLIKRLISPKRKRAKDLPKDSSGKIIVDVTDPHIIEDTDYFRPSAIKFQKDGRYTDLRPNPNPNSEYGKWIREEIRRCYEGYVRESDGEWITGDMYFFLNYCPIQLIKKEKNGKNIRVLDFPLFWEGHYYKFHYLEQCREQGKHAVELASRFKGKSYCGAALLAKRFVLGESKYVNKKVQCMVTASEKKYLTGGNQILDMFQYYIDFCANNTQFPYRRITSSLQNMQWTMGYIDANTNTRQGTGNSVMGITSKDDESKLRGTRGVLYLIEEAGTFPRLLNLFQVLLPSVQDGKAVYGLIFAYGTAGDTESDFSAMQEMMYNPVGYNVKELNNVFDKEGQGRREFSFFFPGYINRAECYNKDGISDVTKALFEILMERYTVKHNSTDINAITRKIAEIPVTPQEAILKSKGNMFPITQLNERINEIDNNPNFYDDTYVGELFMKKDGKVEFKPTNDEPIRVFPLKDNKVKGALEIYQMPELDKSGKVYRDRYIVGHDPVDSDVSGTMSLSSTFVLDLYTDKIVAEYTGRSEFADDNFEKVRLMCIFYNAKCLYEAHPYDQLVRLPDGSTKEWGQIQVGDSLLAPKGKTVTVIDIPVDGVDDIYELTLADGRKVQASKNHLWKVIRLNQPNKSVILTTEQLYNKGAINKHGQKNFFIPTSGAVNYPDKEVPIDAYTLGLLIAEGAFTKFNKQKHSRKVRRHVQFSSSKEDALFYTNVIPYEMKYIGTKGYSWHLFIDDIDKKLESLGLLHKNSHSKFIPDIYMYNSYEKRLELLKGLMDGDGCASSNGASIFITSSKKLAEDIILLCRSLGLKAMWQKGIAKHDIVAFNGKNKGIKKYKVNETYRVAICADIPIFKLPRKVEKQHVYKPHAKGSKAAALLYKTGISDIKYVGKKQCKCVTVDAEDGLYLIGDYVTTHNCNIKGLYSYFSRFNCTHMLADTPEYLRDKQLIKSSGWGNASKGVTATAAINNYANELIKAWLLKPVPTIVEDAEGQHEINVLNLYFIKNRALLKELVAFNPFVNVDRVRALGMVMLYREEKLILYRGDVRTNSLAEDSTFIGNDEFFTRNYDDKFAGSKFSALP